MSLKIIKSGLLDTLQDGGRSGYAYSGITACGPMDRFSAYLANALLGKEFKSILIEIHFPAPVIEINAPCIFCLTGADFNAEINGIAVKNGHPFFTKRGTLKFNKPVSGNRACISFLPSLIYDRWLGSGSTDLKIGKGGFRGRRLEKGDVLEFERPLPQLKLDEGFLSWNALESRSEGGLRIIPGPEFDWLNENGKQDLVSATWNIAANSDRMGIRLSGSNCELRERSELLSSCVTEGTVQLTPGGELVVFMADHPTTGGYPRIASVISTDIGRLSQYRTGDAVRFKLTDIETAEKLFHADLNYLEMMKETGKKNVSQLIKT